MTKAAGGLHLTQSALSHQLRDIESRLNTKLFLRVGKRMVLSEAGRRVLDSATRVLDELGRVEEDIRRLATNGRRHHPGRDPVQYRLSLASAAAQCLRPQASAGQRQHHADITDRAVEALSRGTARSRDSYR